MYDWDMLYFLWTQEAFLAVKMPQALTQLYLWVSAQASVPVFVSFLEFWGGSILYIE